ncbi:hypothetical protein B842_11355 [Corynebacterium humireducens NBRC 106098 = DSM 45392]|uniref:Porin n=1 Tax=Corynebacterium humireducens NBRC 106098 = DSM 45392 TaxID=1223515 RepID=A0A0B5DD16_9CORY|nr:PorH family porin [Corynebacterium humireducens]AJE34118.1 hypothetical protein B842_11355 [Corynebacterium humireducens NBRC 106098 = DSM 45392]
MDLGTIQGQLNDFTTFAKNIGTALAGIPANINAVIDFVQGFGDAADTTSAVLSSSDK